MPLEIALNSQAQDLRFPPAPTRNWAYQAGTTGFIGMPFRGFLGPPSETADLTRILRRRLAFLDFTTFPRSLQLFCIFLHIYAFIHTVYGYI